MLLVCLFWEVNCEFARFEEAETLNLNDILLVVAPSATSSAPVRLDVAMDKRTLILAARNFA